jgi:5-methylcytosine-specific restriction endonuclease McrA
MELKHRNKKHNYCIDCNKEIHLSNKRCMKCNIKYLRKKYAGKGNPRSGIKMSEFLKNKIRKSVLKNPRKSKFTNKHLIKHNYSSILCSKRYGELRKKVLKRDNYKCKLCSNKMSLVVHHIKDRNKYWKLFFKITNLITLCRKCHSYLHNIGAKGNKFKNKQFHNLLQEIKNG